MCFCSAMELLASLDLQVPSLIVFGRTVASQLGGRFFCFWFEGFDWKFGPWSPLLGGRAPTQVACRSGKIECVWFRDAKAWVLSLGCLVKLCSHWVSQLRDLQSGVTDLGI